MSFKREGDDSALLNNLQHRRVAELLGNHIPEHEASLLSNGRLTCLICSYRPVFDTISTLAVHRQGKKHIHELSKYLQHKANLESRATKETQKTHVYAGLTTKEPAASQPLRRTPCKSRRFLHERPMVLEMPAATPAANVLTLPADTVPSAASLVRKYLKSVERSRPIQKLVEKSRENLATSSDDANTGSSDTQGQDGVKHKENKTETTGVPPEQLVERSGWRLNKSGEWEKDPEAEFESEDEDL